MSLNVSNVSDCATKGHPTTTWFQLIKDDRISLFFLKLIWHLQILTILRTMNNFYEHLFNMCILPWSQYLYLSPQGSRSNIILVKKLQLNLCFWQNHTTKINTSKIWMYSVRLCHYLCFFMKENSLRRISQGNSCGLWFSFHTFPNYSAESIKIWWEKYFLIENVGE